jgi:hypothetical protein
MGNNQRQPIELRIDVKSQKLVGDSNTPVNLEYIAQESVEGSQAWEDALSVAKNMGADAYFVEFVGADVVVILAESNEFSSGYQASNKDPTYTLEYRLLVTGYKTL